MKYIYRIYQICIAAPICLVMTLLTALTTSVGCMVGNGHFWGYYPGMLWAKVVIRMFLLPVRVKGRENIEKGHSYVFVANHQGAFDIFLIYGYLHRNFKWLMKWQLGKIPFVGYACKKAHHIFVDRRSPGKVRQTYEEARQTLSEGMSVVVFPEGSRTLDGKMGEFRKGAFTLADELELPVVPLTINGSFDILPRSRSWHFLSWHSISLTIHEPIYPTGKGPQNVQAILRQSFDSVRSALDDRYK